MTFTERAKLGSRSLRYDISDENTPLWHKVALILLCPIAPFVWLGNAIYDDIVHPFRK